MKPNMNNNSIVTSHWPAVYTRLHDVHCSQLSYCFNISVKSSTGLAYPLCVKNNMITPDFYLCLKAVHSWDTFVKLKSRLVVLSIFEHHKPKCPAKTLDFYFVFKVKVTVNTKNLNCVDSFFWTTKPFVTKLGMAIQRHKLGFCAKNWVAIL